MNASDNPFSAWTDAWMNAQRQYMDKMGSFTPPANGMGAAEPLKRSLDSWWQTVQPGSPEPTRELFSRLIGLGKQFFALSEAIARQSKSVATLGEAGVDWHKALEQIAGDLHPNEDFAGPWVQMLGTWQEAMSRMGDLAPHADSQWDPRIRLNRFLEAPGVGYTREQQDDAKELARLGMEYLRALQDYKAAFARIGLQAIERLEERLRDMGEEGKKLGSLREVYDLWVDCGEEVYAEYVFTE
ncbi:MAG: hypothetical protein LJE84_01905, partial [Gammaproteobacteria bacterium]|nr:hypothetical protein [Gammaproteobacteria bacterium]